MSAIPLSQSKDIPALTELLAKSCLKGKHSLSVKQFGPSELDQLLAVAREMRVATEQKRVLNILNGVVLGEIFYEPSTRTSTSFDAAMKRVGGQTAILNESYSSTQKGESLEDTIRTVGQYTDAIVLRHPDENAVDAAAIVSPVPIINGGNGAKDTRPKACWTCSPSWKNSVPSMACPSRLLVTSDTVAPSTHSASSCDIIVSLSTSARLQALRCRRN
jgi:carbamoyl-phosphate synthase / aspartate carbamoyltransferase